MGFVIRNAEGKEFKLESLAAFEQLYEPHGYAILDPQPLGGVLPERFEDTADVADPPKQETAKERAAREKAEKDAAEKAEADAKAAAEAEANARDAAQ